jgi:hypothetical protein
MTSTLNKIGQKVQDHKRSTLEKSLRGIIVVSPILWLLINIMVLGLAILLMPSAMIVSNLLMVFLFALIINGWFWAGLLTTYLFRDQSKKFECPNFSAPLGEKDGFVTYVPAQIEKGKIIEPQYIIRRIGGFSAFGLHTKGNVIVAYPAEYEKNMLAGGIVCFCWLRSCSIDQVAENVRNSIVREGVLSDLFTASTDIRFSRTIYIPGQQVPEETHIAWDVGRDAYIAEINRLKAMTQEKDYQLESYETSRSREAFKLRPADDGFREKYNVPPESVDEKTRRLYQQADEELDERRRRRRSY